MTGTATALATAAGAHLFWITSRAAGIAALLLSSAAVSAGLLMGGRFATPRASELRVLHEALSLSTLAALCVHGLSLIGDPYLHPGLLDVAVPFAGGHETLWSTAGILAFWALVLLGLSYYLRARIGVQRWRKLHRFTALAWILGIAHSLGEGTDAGQAWFLVMTAIVALPALVLLTLRTAPSSRARRSRSASHAVLTPPRGAPAAVGRCPIRVAQERP